MTKSQLVDRLPSTAASAAEVDVKEILEPLIVICKLFGMESDVTEKTYGHWRDMVKDCGGNWMKVAKYKLAAFTAFYSGDYMSSTDLELVKVLEAGKEAQVVTRAQANARHTQVILPQSPFSDKITDRPDHLFGGGAGRWLTRQMKSNGEKKAMLLASIKQSKKGMPRPNKQDLQRKKEEFLDFITKQQPQMKPSMTKVHKWADYDKLHKDINFDINKFTAELELRRTVREVFVTEQRDDNGQVILNEKNKPVMGPMKMTWEERVKAFVPSTSANYINSRKNGGAIGWLLEETDLLKGLRKPGGQLKVEHKEDQDEKITSDENFDGAIHIDETDFKKSFETLWVRVLKHAVNEVPNVEPVALAEPLKVRMITKGPPGLMTLMRSYWKVIHKKMRQHRVFQLIGKPVNEEILMEVLGNSGLKYNEYYMSGDYEAATDNLHSWVSNIIADEIGNVLDLGNMEKLFLKRSLTGHMFSTGPQQTGQLMGSITSFTTLCIANATVCRWAMEIAQNNIIKLEDARMLINGDDVVLRSRSSVLDVWRQVSQFFGLKESVGKTYFSQTFLDINSTNFMIKPHKVMYKSVTTSWKKKVTKLGILKVWPEETVRLVERTNPFVQTPYVNAGLLFGLKRSQGGINLNDQTSNNDIGTKAEQLLALAPKEMKSQLMKKFLLIHKELLAKYKLPWYIPKWLGGLGLPTWSGGKPTELDLRIAQQIIFNWKNRRPVPMGKQETPWKIWQLAQRNLPQPLYTTEKGPHTEAYNDIIGRRCIDLLFDSDIPFEKIYSEFSSVNSGVHAVRHNERIWRAGSYKKLPSPIEEWKLEFQALYPNYVQQKQRSSTTRDGLLD